MRELVEESGVCRSCGARAADAYERGAVCVEGGGGTFYREPEYVAAIDAPRVRSGLAYAAGYAGLAYLLVYPLGSAVFRAAWVGRAAGVSLMLFCGLWAPLALGLAYAAGAALDRSPEKSGRLPALVGLLVGLYGTFAGASAALNAIRFFDIF